MNSLEFLDAMCLGKRTLEELEVFDVNEFSLVPMLQSFS